MNSPLYTTNFQVNQQVKCWCYLILQALLADYAKVLVVEYWLLLSKKKKKTTYKIAGRVRSKFGE